MTDKKQPEALRLADWVESVVGGPHAKQCAAELRRLHAENTTLQAGYAAARLEIESLRADLRPGPGSYPVPQPAGEYPALPKPGHRGPEGTGSYFDSFTADQMRAYVDADRAMRAAQPAELPEIDRDYMRKVVAVAVTMLFDGYKEDVMRVFSTGELSEFVTITAAMGGDLVEDIYRRAWDLLSLPVRASRGQAPAQAAPAAVAGPPGIQALMCVISSLRDTAHFADEEGEATNDLRTLRDWAVSQAAAPTTQPAPRQAPSHTSMQLAEMVLSDCGHSSNYTPLLERVAARIDAHVGRLLGDAPSPAAQVDELDAARLDWLENDVGCRVFHLGKSWYTRNNFGMPYRKRASLREAIDAARAAHQEGEAP